MHAEAQGDSKGRSELSYVRRVAHTRAGPRYVVAHRDGSRLNGDLLGKMVGRGIHITIWG